MIIEQKTTYISTDGSEFDSWDDAYNYDKAWEIANNICHDKTLLDDYITMIRALLSRYNVWEI